MVATNTSSFRVSWLAPQFPQDGILTGYTVYYRSLPNASEIQTFPPTTTSGDITNLNANEAYQFGVVALVTVMGMLYSGEVNTSFADSLTITPGEDCFGSCY